MNKLGDLVGRSGSSSWTRLPFRKVHLVSIALCAIFLPWSTAYLSMAQMLMVANWLAWGMADGGLEKRLGQVFDNRPALVFLSFFGIHLLGLAWTSPQGMQWGMDLVRILLPVLTFGVVLSSTPRLNKEELRTLLLLGAWSVVASTVTSLVISDRALADYRALSVFISHIRLGLMLCFAIAVFLVYLPRTAWGKAAHLMASLWALYYLNALGSLPGAFMLLALVLVFAWIRAGGLARGWRVVLRIVLVLGPLLMIAGVAVVLHRNSAPPVPERSGWGEYTASGEPYSFDAGNPQRENGEHVWAWIAWDEVARTWPLRSNKALQDSDAQGHPLSGTLVRYMTALHLRKDSAGVMRLSDADIRNIEQGITNPHTQDRSQIRQRFDEIAYEIGQYRALGRANGHSVTMRLEYKKIGFDLVRQHWWSGVGTGDTQVAFSAAHAQKDNGLEPRWWLRAHDQYLTWAVSFGVFGLAWILFSLLWPAWQLGAGRHGLFLAWAIIFGLSNLSNDTVETQAGATFFALYYTLFVFAAPRDQEG